MPTITFKELTFSIHTVEILRNRSHPWFATNTVKCDCSALASDQITSATNKNIFRVKHCATALHRLFPKDYFLGCNRALDIELHAADNVDFHATNNLAQIWGPLVQRTNERLVIVLCHSVDNRFSTLYTTMKLLFAASDERVQT